ncbi:hypothetical protein PoB_003226000 [Plakobranchus ocellatus]|uniref:Uncharacterized protein n=1 Tax=Plakobranchus ocellatus TaxID=259542 RepID=A0AAV4AC59_9GAST|nr:hypothetical protein PoB_003226000 [Plakobranchus ocellatus]
MGDCCPDYFSVCASARSTGQILSLTLRNSQAASADDVNDNDYELWIVSQYLKYGSCRETTLIHYDILEMSDMWMIATCPESFTDYYGGAIAEQCETEARNKLFSYPVSYRWFRHLVYKSIFCAMCHDVQVEDILFWLTVHDLPRYLPCKEIRNTPGRMQLEYTAFAHVWYDQGTIAN